MKKHLKEDEGVNNILWHALPVRSRAGLSDKASVVDTSKVPKRVTLSLLLSVRILLCFCCPVTGGLLRSPPPFVKVDGTDGEV